MSTLTQVQKQTKGTAEMQALVMAEQVALSLKQINSLEVKDDSTSEIMKGNVKLIKSTIKSVGELRTKFTKPLDLEKAAVIAIEKTLIKPLEDANTLAQKKINDYLEEQRKKQAAEERALRAEQMRKEQFKELLLSFVNSTMADFTKAVKAKTLESLKVIFDKRLDKSSKDSQVSKLIEQYPEKQSDLEIAEGMLMVMGGNIRNYVKDLIDLKQVKGLLEQTKADLDEKFQLSLDDVGEVEEQQIRQSQTEVTKAAKGTYVVLSYSVQDVDKVPDKYLVKTVNDNMVEMIMKENEAKIVSGDFTVPGLKFSFERKIRG